MGKGELSYKYQRLRERLRAAVENGEWCKKLPGERELASRFSANVKTVNKALNDLVMDGLLSRHVGRGTFIAKNHNGDGISPPPDTARSYAWLAPGRIDSDDLEQVFGLTRSFLAAKGHNIEQFASELDVAGELPEAALTPGAMRKIDGAVVYLARPSRGFLANLRRRHLPVVLINNYHEEIRLPTVLCDNAHAAFTLCEQCILLGHQRIQFLAPPQSLPASTAAQRGYQAAMGHYGLPSLPCLLVDSQTDWTRVLTEGERPTALICLSGMVARQACECIEAAGLRVPADVSVGVISEPGETYAKNQELSAYEVNTKLMLQWAADLMLAGTSTQAPAMVIVPGQYVDRGSICSSSDGSPKSPMPVREATI